LCDLVIQPTVTGPMIEIEGTASQSSTVSDAEASRAIDGNLDQTWIGKSVTHTSQGDDDDLDPWWQLELTDETSVEHVRIFNRNDCCGSRLNNAILELYDASGEVVFTRNLGQAENIKEVFLGGAYTIQMIRIKLYGYKPRDRQPDYARVLTYISVGDEPRLTCETTAAPTASLEPSLSPTVTYSPTIFRAVPNDVVLLRDNTPCIFQVNPANHPDRYKCTLERTASNSEPGGSNNTPVLIAGFNDCVIEIQPMTWSWAGTMFIFESDASLEDVNACFITGQLLKEMRPVTPSPKPTLPQLSDKPTDLPTESPSTAEPTLFPLTLSPTSNPTGTPTLEVCSPIPNDVVLKRDSNPCVFQHNPSNHVDRYKCTLEQTVSNGEPGGSDNAPVAISGFEGCVLVVKPMTWSWAGTMFIFESDDSIETINGCFAAGELLSWADTGSGYIGAVTLVSQERRLACLVDDIQYSLGQRERYPSCDAIALLCIGTHKSSDDTDIHTSGDRRPDAFASFLLHRNMAGSKAVRWAGRAGLKGIIGRRPQHRNLIDKSYRPSNATGKQEFRRTSLASWLITREPQPLSQFAFGLTKKMFSSAARTNLSSQQVTTDYELIGEGKYRTAYSGTYIGGNRNQQAAVCKCFKDHFREIENEYFASDFMIADKAIQMPRNGIESVRKMQRY
ncbi:hypothetical protein THAOC_13554, partial [Thalassiosira oceanica]